MQRHGLEDTGLRSGSKDLGQGEGEKPRSRRKLLESHGTSFHRMKFGISSDRKSDNGTNFDVCSMLRTE